MKVVAMVHSAGFTMSIESYIVGHGSVLSSLLIGPKDRITVFDLRGPRAKLALGRVPVLVFC